MSASQASPRFAFYAAIHRLIEVTLGYHTMSSLDLMGSPSELTRHHQAVTWQHQSTDPDVNLTMPTKINHTDAQYHILVIPNLLEKYEAAINKHLHSADGDGQHPSPQVEVIDLLQPLSTAVLVPSLMYPREFTPRSWNADHFQIYQWLRHHAQTKHRIMLAKTLPSPKVKPEPSPQSEPLKEGASTTLQDEMTKMREELLKLRAMCAPMATPPPTPAVSTNNLNGPAYNPIQDTPTSNVSSQPVSSTYSDGHPDPSDDQMSAYRQSSHWDDIAVILRRKFSPTIQDAASKHRYFLPRVAERELHGTYGQKCIYHLMQNRSLIPTRRLGVSSSSTGNVTMEERSLCWRNYLLQFVSPVRDALETGLPCTSWLLALRSAILSDISARGEDSIAHTHNFVNVVSALEADRPLWQVMRANGKGEVHGDTSILLDLFLELLSRMYSMPSDETQSKRRFDSFKRQSVGSLHEAMRVLQDLYLQMKNPPSNPNNLPRTALLSSREHVMNILEKFMEVIENDKHRPWAAQLRNNIRRDVDDCLSEMQLGRKDLTDLSPTPTNQMMQKWVNFENFLNSEHERENQRTNRKDAKPRRNADAENETGEAPYRTELTKWNFWKDRASQRLADSRQGYEDTLAGRTLTNEEVRELRRQVNTIKHATNNDSPDTLRSNRAMLKTSRSITNPRGEGMYGKSETEEKPRQPRPPRNVIAAAVPPPPPPPSQRPAWAAEKPWGRGGGRGGGNPGGPVDRQPPRSQYGNEPPPSYNLQPFVQATDSRSSTPQGRKPVENGDAYNHAKPLGQRATLIPPQWTTEEQEAFKRDWIKLRVLDNLINTPSAAEAARLRPMQPYNASNPPRQATGSKIVTQVDNRTGEKTYVDNACDYCSNTPPPPPGDKTPPTHHYVFGHHQAQHSNSRCYACKLAILYSKDDKIRAAFCPPELAKYRDPPRA